MEKPKIHDKEIKKGNPSFKQRKIKCYSLNGVNHQRVYAYYM